IETGIRYKKFRKALEKDITTTVDEIAVDSLTGSKKFGTLVGDKVFEKNSKIQATRANLKALGMIKKKDLDELDGLIVMNSLMNVDSVSWNYNFLEEPQENELDFLSVALHEMGHNLGFVSGVDIQSWNEESINFDGKKLDHSSTMDLFRYSLESSELNINDLTFGRAAYFSIDGTLENAKALSTGADYQASHFTNGDQNTGLGIMNPTIGLGERWEISEHDLTVFDTIGWDVDYTAEIDLEALFDNAETSVNDAVIVERNAEIDEILLAEPYNWAWRSSGSSSSGWWQTGYWSTYESTESTTEEVVLIHDSSEDSNLNSSWWNDSSWGEHPWWHSNDLDNNDSLLSSSNDLDDYDSDLL
ncbi:MAG: NF038122 family metalloprotease, partial [Cyanobacteria bacterium P01_F01_bin.143]